MSKETARELTIRFSWLRRQLHNLQSPIESSTIPAHSVMTPTQHILPWHTFVQPDDIGSRADRMNWSWRFGCGGERAEGS